MSIQQKTPRRVTVTPADPKYTEKDIRKQHLRVAPYCRVSTDSEEQLNSYNAQIPKSIFPHPNLCLRL